MCMVNEREIDGCLFQVEKKVYQPNYLKSELKDLKLFSLFLPFPPLVCDRYLVAMNVLRSNTYTHTHTHKYQFVPSTQ